MTWFGGQHEDRKVAFRFDPPEVVQHLEAVQAGHLEIEQDQVVAVSLVQLADLVWIQRRCDGRVPGAAQHALQQKHTGLLIVDDEDLCGEHVGGIKHDRRRPGTDVPGHGHNGAA